MHMTNPDLVSIKTAARQLAARLANEVAAANQWANLSKNRGVPEAGNLLNDVSELIDKARVAAEAAAEKLFEVQEAESSLHDNEH